MFRGTDCHGLTASGRGRPLAEVTRALGVSEQTYYLWRKKYGQMAMAEIRRLRQLEEENR
ncbi:MAG: hypothetical protein C5B60_05145, partial [Chloroflexi bacterium]